MFSAQIAGETPLPATQKHSKENPTRLGSNACISLPILLDGLLCHVIACPCPVQTQKHSSSLCYMCTVFIKRREAWCAKIWAEASHTQATEHTWLPFNCTPNYSVSGIKLLHWALCFGFLWLDICRTQNYGRVLPDTNKKISQEIVLAVAPDRRRLFNLKSKAYSDITQYVYKDCQSSKSWQTWCFFYRHQASCFLGFFHHTSEGLFQFSIPGRESLVLEIVEDPSYSG